MKLSVLCGHAAKKLGPCNVGNERRVREVVERVKCKVGKRRWKEEWAAL